MKINEFTLFILVGGLGTRLRSAVADRPKCMALIHRRPFIEYLLDQVIAAGFRKAILCTGHRAEQVERHLGNGYRELGITYSRELEPLGTGGAVMQALWSTEGEHFFIMNGDSYADLPLRKLASAYLPEKMSGILGLVHMEECSRYGQVELASNGTITAFREKSTHSGPGWINAGIYVFSRKTLQLLPASGPSSLEKYLFPKLVSQGLHGHGWKSRFIDIGTPESYQSASEFFAAEAGIPSRS